MKKLIQGLYTGERALYNSHNLEIIDGTFEDGESPLKESSDLILTGGFFKWKYPLWYCQNIVCNHVTWIDTARSGIWYTNHITLNDCHVEAPKQFRRASFITLNNVSLMNAQETLWNCQNIKMENVVARGDYLCLNSENIEINNFVLDGNYAFDGAKNIRIHHAKMNSKDSFWNCENVEVYDSIIVGEYLAWNSKNIKFINCTIDSEQGICYTDNIELINCKLINTNLCFERCNNVNADIISKIDSVKNPYSGVIKAPKIDEIILDKDIVDPSKTKIIAGEKHEI